MEEKQKKDRKQAQKTKNNTQNSSKKEISEEILKSKRSNKPRQNGKKPIIELKNVQKDYQVGKNDVHVLKDVNIKIYPEEFIIILGPSGSGKSTLLNSLLGLEYPSSGNVFINGTDIAKMSIDDVARFRFKKYGIVFQRADWVKSLTVIQNIALPLFINNRPKKECMDVAWRLIKEVGMEDHADYTASELSGGQQQKICLARSLVNDPPIIVADEPTGNLDTVSSERVMNMFKDLNEKNKKTMVMVTHDINYVRYASRTIYVRDGRIVESGKHFKT